jgi:tetratricopeptide (TPR) repeat protein
MLDQIETLINHAAQARREHRPSGAQSRLVEAVRLAREAGSSSSLLLATALTALGQIERDLNHPAEALRHYEEAAAIYRASGDALKLAHTIRHIGDIHRNEKRYTEAEPYYREALGIYRAHPEASQLDVANAIRGFALLNGAIGNTAEAKALWEEARELYARVKVDAGVAESTRQIAALSGL